MIDNPQSKPVWVEKDRCIETNKKRDDNRMRLTSCCGCVSYKVYFTYGIVHKCRDCHENVKPGYGDGTQMVPVRPSGQKHYEILDECPYPEQQRFEEE